MRSWIDLFESEPIRLSLTKKTPGRAKEFMEEFWAETHRHPFMPPQNRLLAFTEDDFVMIVCSESLDDPNGIHISDINTLDRRGKGLGTRALQWLHALADKHRVTLSGLSKSYMQDQDTSVLKQKDLTAWYARHGYETKKAEDGHSITRRPTPPADS